MRSGRLVSIRNLLGHSSGIPDLGRRPDLLEILKRPATPAEVVRNYCSDPLEFDPGSRFKYCNCGYLILGTIYERVSGQSYSEGIQRLISRAGLRDTGISGPRDVVPRLATAYVVENGTAKGSLHRMVSCVRVRRIVFVGARSVAVAVRAHGWHGARQAS